MAIRRGGGGGGGGLTKNGEQTSKNNNKAKGQYSHLPSVVHDDSQSRIWLCYTFTTVSVTLLNKYFICLVLLTMTKLMMDNVLQLPLVVHNSHIYRCHIYILYIHSCDSQHTCPHLLPVAFSDGVEIGITTTGHSSRNNIQYTVHVHLFRVSSTMTAHC